MKERTETNTFQKAFLAFFLILFAALTSCSKKSSSDESPAAIPPPNNPAFDAVAKEIRQIVKGLEYPDEVGQDLATMVSGWKCDIWKQKIDKAKRDYQDNNLSLVQLANIEEEEIQELYRRIHKEFTYDTKYEHYDLPSIIIDKKASCLGFSQLFYILGNSLGLNVQVLDVFEQDNNSLPKNPYMLPV